MCAKETTIFRSKTTLIIHSYRSTLFFVPDHGKILKTVNAESADSNKKVTSVVIEEIDALQTNEPIRTLEIVRTTQYGKE